VEDGAAHISEIPLETVSWNDGAAHISEIPLETVPWNGGAAHISEIPTGDSVVEWWCCTH